MSENVAQTCNDSDGVTKQAVHSSHQSVWMSHWMSSTNCKSTRKQACGRLSICYESHEEDDSEPKRENLVGGSEKAGNGSEEREHRSSEVTETKSIRFMDDQFRSSFPMFNLRRKGDAESARKDDRASSSHWESVKPQTDPNDTGYQLFSLSESEKHLPDLPPMIQLVCDTKAPSREDPFKAECISEYQAEEIAESSKVGKEKSTKGDFLVSSSKITPYGFNFRKAPALSVCEGKEMNQSKSIMESGQRVTNTVYHSNSMFLVHDRAVSNPFERSRNPSVTYNYTQLLPRDLSTSRSQQPEFIAKQYQKIQEHSGVVVYPSKNNPVDLSKPEEYHGSLPGPSCHVHDIGAVGTCTVDSVEELSQSHKKFSTSTKHHFLFAKTSFNLSEGRRGADSSALTKLKEKFSSEPFHFSQEAAFPVRSGVKLQLIGSPVGSEGEKDAQEIKTSSVNRRNESSSETNIMDLDTFRKNYVSGIVSSVSDKRIELEHRTPISQATLDSAREIEGTLPRKRLPDINQQPNNVAVHASSMDTSTSRTQSLDAEHLLSNAEQPISYKFNARTDSFLESEPSSRWVKRLKTSHTSASGTQSSKMGEDSSHEKFSNIFSKIVKFSVTSSDRITGRSLGKEPANLNQKAILLGAKSPSTGSVRKGCEVTLLHPWIRRLCHNTVSSSNEKSKAASASGSQHSKASTDKADKKQFPSLVAMALMGRALRGNRPCKLNKKGSSVVWNS